MAIREMCGARGLAHGKPSGSRSHDDLDISCSLGKPNSETVAAIRSDKSQALRYGWGRGEAGLQPGIIAKDQLRKCYSTPMILLLSQEGSRLHFSS